MSSNSNSDLQTVKNLGADLSKAIIPTAAESSSGDEAAAVTEQCRDLLQRLDECNMTLAILSETMIGKTVSQLKSHPSLGPTAKALVKKWKGVAKMRSSSSSISSNGNSDNYKPASIISSVAKKAAIKKEASRSSSASASQKKKAAPPSEQQRRGSTQSAAASLGEDDDDGPTTSASDEWAGLPPMRQNICKKFYESVFLTSKAELVKQGINAAAIDHLLAPRATEVEAAIWTLQGAHGDKKAYADKARSLVFNLKKNTALTQSVILGQVTAEDLVNMTSEQLAPPEAQKAKADAAKKLLDSKRLDWDQANEAKINEMCGIKGDLLSASLFTCGRCKSTKTTSTQKQTRSADEPMTVFVLCLNCGKRWKC